VLPRTAAVRWEEIIHLGLGAMSLSSRRILMDTPNTRKQNEETVVNFVTLCELCGQFILYGFSESPEICTAQIILSKTNAGVCGIFYR
jgi:hypothetical protein